MTGEFRPTHLYIKKCSHCDLHYFGKTTVKDPKKYSGSGSYWKRHLRKHGANAIHVQSRLFLDQKTCTRAAIRFSKRYDIVGAVGPDGHKLWANQSVENGLDGALVGHRFMEGLRWFNDGVRGYRLDPNDPRTVGLTKGQLHASSRGRKWFNDGKSNMLLDPSDPRTSSLRCGNLSLGQRRFNDGIRNYVLDLSKASDRALSKKLHSGIISKASKGWKWYNDGKTCMMLDPRKPADKRRIRIEGLAPGNLYSRRSGLVWFTDGVNSWMLNLSDPRIKRDGLVPGRIINKS